MIDALGREFQKDPLELIAELTEKGHTIPSVAQGYEQTFHIMLFKEIYNMFMEQVAIGIDINSPDGPYLSEEELVSIMERCARKISSAVESGTIHHILATNI